MRIPQKQNLVSQNFNSKNIEFCWRFPLLIEGYKDQLLCQIGYCTLYFEAGMVNDAGIYIGGLELLNVGFGHLNPEWFIDDHKLWTHGTFPAVYNNFQNGKDLIPLVADVLEYFKKN